MFGANMKKKFRSALLDPPGRYTGNNFLFKGGLSQGQRNSLNDQTFIPEKFEIVIPPDAPDKVYCLKNCAKLSTETVK